jgi:hypothetical protein
MKSIRRLHAWLGVLFAPSIIFFALSGALQLFGLHETERGETPGLVAKMGMVHTHQTTQMPQRKPQPQARAAPPQVEPARPAQPKPTTLPIKVFFALMASSLIVSSGLGLWIAFTSKRDRTLHVVLLAAGVVLPVLLLAL